MASSFSLFSIFNCSISFSILRICSFIYINKNIKKFLTFSFSSRASLRAFLRHNSYSLLPKDSTEIFFSWSSDSIILTLIHFILLTPRALLNLVLLLLFSFNFCLLYFFGFGDTSFFEELLQSSIN